MHDSCELRICGNAPCSQFKLCLLLVGTTNAAQVRCWGRFCVEIRIWDLLNMKQQEMFSKPILMLFSVFTPIVFCCQFWHHACYKHKNPLAVAVNNTRFILCLYILKFTGKKILQVLGDPPPAPQKIKKKLSHSPRDIHKINQNISK